ncbi:hypothetical protein MYCTH_95997 [Thermothelomyces thermophilus ATCC 42464]|uniref:Uncharacterized protein n=1 Tax=Thermothelomyces thermophilus (strain ATCC 42464 / BCRC 31852 / DSM 1799) TaxID=573729 RepID=G2QJV7_THET4|nr:uncharacterized protein MYCTH_95997 [Thermothelomyces thermophilus ATCC 42464]AEO59863.1 hypothetical protein MYCTH_95997 [Thermothelomyces thermophilus ATCC 42464]
MPKHEMTKSDSSRIQSLITGGGYQYLSSNVVFEKLSDRSPKDAPLHLWRTNTTMQQSNVKDSSNSSAFYDHLHENGASRLPYSLASYQKATEGTGGQFDRLAFGGSAFGGSAPVLYRLHQPGDQLSSKQTIDKVAKGRYYHVQFVPKVRSRGFGIEPGMDGLK